MRSFTEPAARSAAAGHGLHKPGALLECAGRGEGNRVCLAAQHQRDDRFGELCQQHGSSWKSGGSHGVLHLYSLYSASRFGGKVSFSSKGEIVY